MRSRQVPDQARLADYCYVPYSDNERSLRHPVLGAHWSGDQTRYVEDNERLGSARDYPLLSVEACIRGRMLEFEVRARGMRLTMRRDSEVPRPLTAQANVGEGRFSRVHSSCPHSRPDCHSLAPPRSPLFSQLLPSDSNSFELSLLDTAIMSLQPPSLAVRSKSGSAPSTKAVILVFAP